VLGAHDCCCYGRIVACGGFGAAGGVCGRWRHARGLFAERSRRSGVRALRLAVGGGRGSRRTGRAGSGIAAGWGRAVVRRGRSTDES
jgi:hypothetical protein